MLRAKAAELDQPTGQGGRVQLARLLKVSQPTVTRWLKEPTAGGNVPEEWRAGALAKVLGCPKDDVLEAIRLAHQLHHEAKVAKVQRDVRSEDVRRLIAAVENLTKAVEVMEERLDALERSDRDLDEGPADGQNSH